MLKKIKETCLIALFASLTIFDSAAHANKLISYSVIGDEDLNHFFQSIVLIYNFSNENNKTENVKPELYFLSSKKFILNGKIDTELLIEAFPKLNNNLLETIRNNNYEKCLVLDFDVQDNKKFIITLNEPSVPADENDYTCALVSLLAYDNIDISNYTDKSLKDLLKIYFEVMGRK